MLAMLSLMASGATVQYSGIPSSSSPDAKNIRVLIESVRFDLSADTCTVHELTLFKSDWKRAASVVIRVPRELWVQTARDDETPFDVNATWDGRLLAQSGPPGQALMQVRGGAPAPYLGFVQYRVGFEAGGTHALRITYQVPIGMTGYENKQREAAFDLSGGSGWSGPIGTLDLSVGYTQKVVFGLPEVSPKWKWQVGQTGTFIRKQDYTPGDDDLFKFVYYPGGFHSGIGGD